MNQPAVIEQSDILTHINDCWEKRAKKHDFRVSMAGEDSETSRHRADELRRCIKELKMLAGIKEEEKPPVETPVQSGPAPVPVTTTAAP